MNGHCLVGSARKANNVGSGAAGDRCMAGYGWGSSAVAGRVSSGEFCQNQKTHHCLQCTIQMFLVWSSLITLSSFVWVHVGGGLQGVDLNVF